MARKITVAGGNLFQLAAATLGDATQANRLAVINGLLDPFSVGISTLFVPAINKSATGGLPFGPILNEAWPWAATSPPIAVTPPPVIQPVVPPAPSPDQPPLTDGPWLWSVLAASLPLPPLPTLTQQLPPSLLAVTVSATVAHQLAWVDPIERSWQPADPAPTIPKTLPPSFLDIPVGQPPGGGDNDPQWWGVLTAWQPLPPLPNLGTPKIIAMGIQVDVPPAGGGVTDPQFSAIISAWQPLPPMPTIPKVLPATLLAGRPVPHRDLWLPGVLASWQPSRNYFYRH